MVKTSNMVHKTLHTQNNKNCAARTTIKTGNEFRYFGRIGSFRFTSGIRPVNQVKTPVISYI